MGFAVPRSNRQTSGVGDYELTDTARTWVVVEVCTIRGVNYEAGLVVSSSTTMWSIKFRSRSRRFVF